MRRLERIQQILSHELSSVKDGGLIDVEKVRATYHKPRLPEGHASRSASAAGGGRRPRRRAARPPARQSARL